MAPVRAHVGSMSTGESVARILVVDDVEEVLDALEKLLESDGYSVDAARTEDRALECAQRNPPDLILLNLAPGRFFPAVSARIGYDARSLSRIRPSAAERSGEPLFRYPRTGRDPSPLVWEAWNGVSWKRLTVVDETAHLTRPGLVSFVAPDVVPRASATITGAAEDRIRVTDALAAAVFRPRDRIVVRQGDGK